MKTKSFLKTPPFYRKTSGNIGKYRKNRPNSSRVTRHASRFYRQSTFSLFFDASLQTVIVALHSLVSMTNLSKPSEPHFNISLRHGSATTPMNFNIGNDIADGTGRRSDGFPNPPAVSIRICRSTLVERQIRLDLKSRIAISGQRRKVIPAHSDGLTLTFNYDGNEAHYKCSNTQCGRSTAPI